jgi:DNA-binding transcriptional ArsR family regulator
MIGDAAKDSCDMPLSEVQKQLRKFEQVGILVSRLVGNSRIYTWNPRDSALEGLKELLRQLWTREFRNRH